MILKIYFDSNKEDYALFYTLVTFALSNTNVTHMHI